eukprot:114370_1
MINKGGFYVRFLNGSLPSFGPIFEDLAPSFVILSQRLNLKLLDKPLFTLDRDDTIGGTRVDDMVITMHQITSQIIHMIRNNTTEWTQTQSQISSASINHESQQFELEELPSLSPQSQYIECIHIQFQPHIIRIVSLDGRRIVVIDWCVQFQPQQTIQ